MDGVALVEQAFLIELLEQPPQRLYILIVVSDVRIVEVYEVAHLFRQVTPFLCEHHHILTALLVIILCRDVFLRCLIVDIGLGDTQFFLHTQFYGQTVCIPTSLTLHLIALHRLIAIEGILDGTSQHMVDAWVTVSRGRTLEEYELRTALTLFDRAPEHVFLSPHLQDVIVDFGQIQTTVLGKFLSHILLFYLFTF